MPDDQMTPDDRMTDAEKRDRLRLIRSENVGPVTFRALMARYPTAGAALDALPELAARGGKRRIRLCPPDQASKELDTLHKAGGRLIALGEAGYPPLLAALPDAPPVLSVLGDPALFARNAVAVVGARNGSANGIRFAERIARDLGAAGLTVVSGLARGIDAAAHRGALATGTVAVMAGGVDVVYPRENEGLYADIRAQGALVSEQPWGRQPQARHFPVRNRIVSGLALATVVVEATLKSGSLITARLAGEQGREVLAVPGNPLDPRAKGANRLIRDGTTLMEGADDVLDAIAGMIGRPAARPDAPLRADADEPAPSQPDESELSEGRARLESLLGPTPVPVDDILRQSGIAPRIAFAILLEMELAGRLERHPGGQVSLAFT